jgi:hypothetical protein
MTQCVAENLAEIQEVSASPPSRHLFRAGDLLVRECVPHGYWFDDRLTRVKVNHVSTIAEALALPWIQRLPGEKRITILHGQFFVVQKCLGWKMIRAHISHSEVAWNRFRLVAGRRKGRETEGVIRIGWCEIVL